jgi:hypothetical protein
MERVEGGKAEGVNSLCHLVGMGYYVGGDRFTTDCRGSNLNAQDESMNHSKIEKSHPLPTGEEDSGGKLHPSPVLAAKAGEPGACGSSVSWSET